MLFVLAKWVHLFPRIYEKNKTFQSKFVFKRKLHKIKNLSKAFVWMKFMFQAIILFGNIQFLWKIRHLHLKNDKNFAFVNYVHKSVLI